MKQQKNIISFDLSLSCTGYSIFRNDAKIITIGSIETSSKDSTPKRLHDISEIMTDLKKEYNPKLVLIERGFSRFNKSTQQIYRVHGICNLIFHDVEQIEIHATSIRKTVYGEGNIKKNLFQEFITNEHKEIKFLNGDEIDSYALGLSYFISRKKENEK